MAPICSNTNHVHSYQQHNYCKTNKTHNQVYVLNIKTETMCQLVSSSGLDTKMHLIVASLVIVVQRLADPGVTSK